MADIITTHRELWKLLSVYHRTPVEKRPNLLAGFVLHQSRNHPDQFIRAKLGQFYAKEALRHGKNCSNPNNRGSSH